MKHRRHACFILGAIALALSVWMLRSVGWAADEGKPQPLPPLRVDRAAPLLLDAPPALRVDKNAPRLDGGQSKTAAPGANVRTLVCYDCHANYAEEPLAIWHAKENVTCVNCHGRSEKHCNDEGNITPPDVMYPLEKIDAKCAECHDSHDVAARDVLKRWQERCPRKTDPAKIVCTDCHGEHRLSLRNVRWDKRTGKLLEDTGEMN